jgi:PAS domain S-box-containing protein
MESMIMANDITRASLELLYRISRELATTIDLRMVLHRVLFLSLEMVKGERGSIVVLDADQQPVDSAIVYRATIQSTTTQQLRETVDRGLAGWVARHAEAVLVPNTSSDARWLRRPDDEDSRSGAKSAICVPLLAYDQLVGVLTVVHPVPDTFNEDSLALMQAIADQAGIAVLNARLYTESQTAQRRYYDLFNDSIDPILITNAQGQILEANRQALETSGYAQDHLQISTIEQLHQVQVDCVGQEFERVSPNSALSYESILNAQDGRKIPIHVTVRRIKIDETDYLQWIMRDISERKDLDAMREDLMR